jgi:hypothetical protein
LPLVTASAQKPAEAKVDFLRDIQPILARHCTSCHGFDPTTRRGGLRLDVRDSAVAKKAVVPGDAKASELIARIESADETIQMPPPEAKKPLDAEQKRLLRAWIEQGAPYAQHWAFVAPKKPAVPTVKNPAWVRNEIDAFVLNRLEREGLQPAPEADRATLLRRVTLDLTGLPPSLDELKAFLADTSPNAYDRVVERLLNSPRHAERLAQAWLDTARYADSNGFNNDEARTQWPWRDWVINAFQTNMPHDRFIVEQLAGDLLPDATLSQKVASAFHRNQVYNTEGGIIPEEYRVEYVADRVHTTATVFLGLSMQCARCHDHKYDPISQREYYQFYAYFNSVIDRPPHQPNAAPGQPFVRVPPLGYAGRLEQIEGRRGEIERELTEREAGAEKVVAAWEKTLTPEAIEKLSTAVSLFHLTLDGKDRGTPHGKPRWTPGKVGNALELDGTSHVEVADVPPLDRDTPFTLALWTNPGASTTGALLSKMDDAAAYRGYDVLLGNGKVVVHMVHHWSDNAIKVSTKKAITGPGWHHVVVTYDGSSKAAGLTIHVDGKAEPVEVLNDSLRGTIQTAKPFHLGKRQASLNLKGKLDDVRIFDRVLTADQVSALHQGQPVRLASDLFTIPADKRTAAQKAQVRRFYLERVDADYSRLQAEISDLARQKSSLETNLPVLMVMQDQPTPRETFVLKRGVYNQPGETVGLGVPGVLPTIPESAPRNRLGLARWLVEPGHPLTARVAVNRYWEMLFGVGIVKTVEDFGTTGEPPSHPELLDHLAVDFVQGGWDLRALLRKIVTSATYRQSSRMTPEQFARDPENRLLARGARHRLSAETIRDNALAISGLLTETLGGPSVKPYQPDGLWEDVTVGRGGKYVADQGANLYRRSMYTFWKRTCPPPTLMSFDAPNREVCLPRRPTPPCRR